MNAINFMLKSAVYFVLAMLCNLVTAAPSQEKRLRPLQVVTEIPESTIQTVEKSFSKNSIVPWAVIGGTSVGLYAADREMLDEVQRWGRSTGIGNSDNTKTVLSVGPYPIFRLPSDTGSALYFLGDGWTHFTIGGSFYLAGQIVSGNRANNTGLEIFHGMIVSTLFSQLLKRSTGRESPSEATSPRGTWRPFPNPNDYGNNTPKYDAFPSGHVMTATLTFTIIHENYPEYDYITLPIGGVWITALGLQMMNNGVHWASDYPLAIGMGYLIGRISSRIGEPEAGEEESSLLPTVFPGQFAQTNTMNLLWKF